MSSGADSPVQERRPWPPREVLQTLGLAPSDGSESSQVRRKTKVSRKEFARMERNANDFAWAPRAQDDESREGKLERSASSPASPAQSQGSTLLRTGASMFHSGERRRGAPNHFFGVSQRPPIHNSPDHQVSPGDYDCHEVGTLKWNRDATSQPGQMSLSQHKSCVVRSFGKPKTHFGPEKPSISQAPGPGHYLMPNYWDPCWQKYPPTGKSFARNPPAPGESRFGGLAGGLVKKGDMDFLGN